MSSLRDPTSGLIPVVHATGLARRFHAEPPVDALRNVSLRVERGDFVAVVGRSGSGKSTLLNILGLMDTQSSGCYRLDGHEVTDLGRAEQAGLRGSKIGFVFQAFHLLAHCTALENVALAGIYRGDSESDRMGRAEATLVQMGLGHRLEAKPTSLSGGERQRVAIARAISSDPSLLLADEPTGNLDSATAVEIMDLFAELHGAGRTIVMITHDPMVAARAARTVEIQDGILDA